MTGITTITSTVTASFLASFVEVVEAFTIILAVGLARGWRPALTGTVLALLLLGALILLLGPLLALTLVALIAVVTLLVKFAGIGGLAGSLLLLAGAIGLLVESVYRDARRKKAAD